MEKARCNTELYSNLRAPLNNVKPSNFWGSHHFLVTFAALKETLKWPSAGQFYFITDSIHWFTFFSMRARMSVVASRNLAAIWLGTCPLKGMPSGSTTSNAEIRSETTITRYSSLIKLSDILFHITAAIPAMCAEVAFRKSDGGHKIFQTLEL